MVKDNKDVHVKDNKSVHVYLISYPKTHLSTTTILVFVLKEFPVQIAKNN